MPDRNPPTRQPTALARVVGRLIPAPYLEAGGDARGLARTFGIAVAIRLVLMPIACHSDLISTYHRAWVILHEFQPLFWVPHQMIEALFLLLYSPFLRLDELLGWQGGMSAPVQFWLESFAPHPQVLLALFLFKIPYLICDLGIALVLLRLFAASPARGLRAVSLWLFNPVTIFVFYVFGRHDSVALLCVALALLALQRSRSVLGALALGIGIWSRYWPALLLPFLAIVEGGTWRRSLRTFAVALAPMALFNVFTRFGYESPVTPAVYMLTESTFADYVLGLRFGLGWSHEFIVFPGLVLLLLMYALVARPRADRVVRFSEYGLLALAALYSTSFFHPQYFTWFIPFLVILRAGESRPVLRNLHYLQLALFVPYTFYWKQTLAGFLLAPLAPDFFIGLPPPSDVVERFYPALTLVNLARTGITATFVFMAGWLLLGDRQREPEPSGASC